MFNVLLWIKFQVNNILSAIKRKKSMDTLILSLVASVCTFLILIYWITKWGCIFWLVLNLCKPFLCSLSIGLNNLSHVETNYFHGSVLYLFIWLFILVTKATLIKDPYINTPPKNIKRFCEFGVLFLRSDIISFRASGIY